MDIDDYVHKDDIKSEIKKMKLVLDDLKGYEKSNAFISIDTQIECLERIMNLVVNND